jgi:hypothetical protein
MPVLKEIRNVRVRFGGESPSGWLPAGAAKPLPTPVHEVSLDLTIESIEGGFIFQWAGPSPQFCGDTWHESVRDAMKSAMGLFGVQPEEWRDAQ